MKKAALLLLSFLVFCSCEKESVSPDVTIFSSEPTKEKYPSSLTFVYVGGDTLFNEQLLMTRQGYPGNYATSANYDLSFSIWQFNSWHFVGSLPEDFTINFSNTDHTKSVSYKLLKQ